MAQEEEEYILNEKRQKLADVSLNSSVLSNTEFDTDDEEQETDLSPLHMDWVDMTEYKLPASSLAISSLPGCRYGKTWRSLDHDIESLKTQGIANVMVFCTKGDLFRYRTKDLLEKYEAAGLEVHNLPHEDMVDPDVADLIKIFDQLELNMKAGKKTLMHCFAGLGRSCLVAACFMMYLCPELDAEKAIENIRSVRGHSAVQSIKQYNFIMDFRKEMKEFNEKKEDSTARALSR